MKINIYEEKKDLDLLKRRIYNDTSLDCHQFKENYLKRRIRVRMHANDVQTYSEYLHVLASHPMEYSHLIKDITINVTQFFRDPKVFQLIEEEIFPLMIYNKVSHNRKVIRCWSAGCASGEEAYSVAILLFDLLGEEFKSFMVSIYGTDIDETSLEIAKIGRYPQIQLENIKPEYLDRYFHFDGEMYQISDELKDMVKFNNQNLFVDDCRAHYDVILCRNVLIYFTKEMQTVIFKKFYDSLNEGGYLIIGKTETVIGDIENRFVTVNAKERIYQKRKLK
jgi:chemotaxis protein methyltransferase CheR